MHTNGISLRDPQPGDIGWVIERHGAIYAEEFGWNEQFEALVAEIAAKFLRHHDAKCERCWIAEKDGVRLGCVFVVKESDEIAKLRLMLIEPSARGLGLGKRLVEECIQFARSAGYTKMTLWTNNVLHAARHIYESAGFQLIHSEPNSEFGLDLIAETWERVL